MNSGIRPALKNVFDGIVYKYPLINRVLRNVNKKLAGVTSFRLRPFGVMDVRFKSGLTFKMATNETSSVTKLLFWRGPDNYEYTPVFEYLANLSSSFADIGANTGYYSLLAATKNPSMRVFAFEPASAPYHYLKRNIAINRLTNIAAYPVALSDRAGEIEFFEVDSPSSFNNKQNLAGTGTMKHDDVLKQTMVTKKVPTVTLDDWMVNEKLSTIDLIKIDTEGTEHLILAGATKLLQQNETIFICETLFNEIEHELEAIMRNHDYVFLNHRGGRLTRTNTLIRETDNGVRDCFFVPSKKLHLLQPFID